MSLEGPEAKFPAPELRPIPDTLEELDELLKSAGDDADGTNQEELTEEERGQI